MANILKWAKFYLMCYCFIYSQFVADNTKQTFMKFWYDTNINLGYLNNQVQNGRKDEQHRTKTTNYKGREERTTKDENIEQQKTKRTYNKEQKDEQQRTKRSNNKR